MFELNVLRKAPGDLPIGEVRAALKDFHERHRTTQGDVADCIAQARKSAEKREPCSPDGPSAPSLFGGIEPDTATTSEVLLEQMRPHLEALRGGIWGSPDPPFARYDEAIAWIEAEAGRECPRDHSEDPEKLLSDTQDLTGRWDRFTGAPVTLSISRPEIHYLKRLGSAVVEQAVKVSYGSPLLRLKEFVELTSLACGLEESTLACHVLTGKGPGLARLSVGFAVASYPEKAPKVWITLRKRKVTFQDLRDAFAMIQHLEQEAITNPPVLVDRKDRAIFEAIQRRGKLPRKNRRVPGEKWEEIAREVSASFPNLTANAVRMRVQRMEREKAIPAEALYRDS
jgi:hypothetical protein